MHKTWTYNPFAVVFYIPSFYGAITWGAWLMLYLFKLIGLDEVSPLAFTIFIAMELFFILSACLAYPHYRDMLHDGMNTEVQRPGGSGFLGRPLLLLLFGLGFFGLLLYVINIARFYGGINYILFALIHEAASIRGDVDLPTSAGTQLSYCGWLAIGLTIYGIASKRLSKWWLILAGMQFFGNLVYIDRTRPMWIIFTALLMILPTMVQPNFLKIIKWAAVTLVLFCALFWVVAEWTGKVYYEDKFENAVIPGNVQVLYAYGVSGFAYFNHMLVNNEPISHKPERLLYPLLKFLAKLGLTNDPPSQILVFYDIPFETNVGTFLEPFYRDGGFLFVLFGALIYSVGFDTFAFMLLRSNNPFALFVWSNLCFTSFIAFFTPKITQFPIWFFIGLALLSQLLKASAHLIMNIKPGFLTDHT